MTAGRPSVFNDEMINSSIKYLDGGYEEEGQVIPSMAGLAIVLGVAKSTLYNWMEDEEHKLLVTLRKVGLKQEVTLLNKGLTGDFNPTIAKLALCNHGYSDRQETELTGKDGAPLIPVSITTKYD